MIILLSNHFNIYNDEFTIIGDSTVLISNIGLILFWIKNIDKIKINILRSYLQKDILFLSQFLKINK